jgi:hypothetical protein
MSRAQHVYKRDDARRQTMTTSLNHGSAKIYQFPVGGRAAIGGRRYEEPVSAANLGAARVSEVAVGGAWYHEAAIQESKPVRER